MVRLTHVRFQLLLLMITVCVFQTTRLPPQPHGRNAGPIDTPNPKLIAPPTKNPGREITTTPLQQLFVLNSEFLQSQAAALVRQVPDLPDSEKVRFLYTRVFARDPKPKEVDLGLSFLAKAKEQAWPEYAQALLATSEFIFLQ